MLVVVVVAPQKQFSFARNRETDAHAKRVREQASNLKLVAASARQCWASLTPSSRAVDKSEESSRLPPTAGAAVLVLTLESEFVLAPDA